MCCIQPIKVSDIRENSENEMAYNLDEERPSEYLFAGYIFGHI